jgi:hypothetical protein
VWSRPEGITDRDQFLNELLPDDVRDLFKAEAASGALELKTISDFKQAKQFYADMERRLVQERVQHQHTSQPAFYKNLKALDEKVRAAGGQPRFAPFQLETLSAEFPEGTYVYLKAPFLLVMAKVEGKPQIVLIEPMSQ